jgi:hypothetical protein
MVNKIHPVNKRVLEKFANLEFVFGYSNKNATRLQLLSPSLPLFH